MTTLLNTNEIIDQNCILSILKPLAKDLSVDLNLCVTQIFSKLPDKIEESTLFELFATTCAALVNLHPDYSLLGGRITVFSLHKKLDVENVSFLQAVSKIYNHEVNGNKSTRISKKVMDFIEKHADSLQSILNYERDLMQYDYPAISAFLKRGLERINDEVAETPSQMYLRVAIGLNVFVDRKPEEIESYEKSMGQKISFDYFKNRTDEERLARIKEYYEILSSRKLSLPGPILMHAGSETNQMASCFLEFCSDSLTEDNYHVDGHVGGIMKAMTQLAAQSKGGAGTAISLTALRSKGSRIAKTNGKSNGILPFMKMFDATIGAIDQSGKRAGVCTIYLEPWHADVLEFLDAADHFMIEQKRCKNLFIALFMNDLFFKRMLEDKQEAKWTLFDPVKAKFALGGVDLGDLYGKEWEEAYLKLESEGIGETISLMEIWNRVTNLFQTTGMPYILNKDQMNIKSNSSNIGTIHSSNICTEIALPSSEKETAVCVLSSVCVGKFYDQTKIDKVDYEGIINTARIATRNLNNVIDLQYYPTPETRNACLARRAIGVGALGLADLFAKLKIAYTSPEAKKINKRIYECIQYGCYLETVENAKEAGQNYKDYETSPASKGILQHNMWGISDEDLFLANDGKSLSIFKEINENPWTVLKRLIKKYGLRNSELTAIAPTMQASIRMEQNEMHEPFGRNVYIRQTIAGSIQMVNKYMVQDLIDLGIWNSQLSEKIIENDGSLLNISEIPNEIKERYLTIYEVDWKERIDMMADRSPFITQTASFNHYVTFEESGPTSFTQRIIYAWKKNLKTLCYYMHTETATTAKKEFGKLITVQEETGKLQENEIKILANGMVCDPNDLTCEACQS
jgi:ribonucleoside-diphosphate reductase alpha subunit